MCRLPIGYRDGQTDIEQRGALTLSEHDRRIHAVRVADCAERNLPLFEARAPGSTARVHVAEAGGRGQRRGVGESLREASGDVRPGDATDGLRAFARGELRIGLVRVLAVRARAAARKR